MRGRPLKGDLRREIEEWNSRWAGDESLRLAFGSRSDGPGGSSAVGEGGGAYAVDRLGAQLADEVDNARTSLVRGSRGPLLPLHVIQGFVAALIVIAGILISAVTGKANIFTAPEYGGTLSVPLHIGGRLLGGLVIGPLIGWAVSSLVMLVTKRVKPTPTRAAATV